MYCRHNVRIYKPFELIVQSCLLITWHIVYSNGLLEMLVVRHHLREERPLHDAHHGGLFLVVRLSRKKKEKEVKS